MNNLTQIIDHLTPSKILVLGDLMLDEYCWGEVERISPEAPIPILNVTKIEHRLGGAASSCHNLSVLGCEVFPVGLLGKDNYGKVALELFQKNKLREEGILMLANYATTLKRRLITSKQQLIRMDIEQKVEESIDFEEALLDKIQAIIPLLDAVLISDYAKGVCTPYILQKTIALANQKKIPIVCDPGKKQNYQSYLGVTTIKPNRIESEQTTQIKIKDQTSVLEVAKKIKNLTKATFISLSLDREGLLYYQDKNDFEFVRTEVQEVSDVTGAGDMMVSVLTALLANHCESLDALKIANHAATLEVTKLGATPLSWNQIQQHIKKKPSHSKLLYQKTLRKELKPRNQREKPLVFVNGYFDEFNSGLLRFLMELKKFYGTVVIGLNSDCSIEKGKGKKPILNQNERADILANIHSIDWIVIFEESNAIPLLKSIVPDIYVKSEFYKGKDFIELATLEELCIQLEFLPFYS